MIIPIKNELLIAATKKESKINEYVVGGFALMFASAMIVLAFIGWIS